MGYPTRVQLIKRTRGSEQWYINFPMAVAQAMDFTRGEVVEWSIEDRTTLLLKRTAAPPLESKKKQKRDSSVSSRASSKKPVPPSGRKGATKGRGR